MQSHETPRTVVYLLRRFPNLSQTFVLNEILMLEKRGITVRVFSLEPPIACCHHEAVSRVKADITYLAPWWRVSPHLKAIWHVLVRSPKTFGRVLFDVVRAGKPILIWRFVQAAGVADALRGESRVRLHAHFATRATHVAAYVAKLIECPYSFTAHAVDIFRDTVDTKVLQRRAADADFVVTVSRWNEVYLKRLLNGSADKVHLVRNGIDLSLFTPDCLGFDRQLFTMLAVARLEEKKGLGFLIDACAMLRDRGVEFRCWIVGDGALEGVLRRRIDDLGVAEHVHLMGPLTQANLIKRYRLADLFVLPSIIGADGNREGLPVAIVEALACSLPVISTAMTGIPEVVRDGFNGLLVPEKDPHALSQSLARVIEDRDLLTRLRSNARRSVTKDYNRDETSFDLIRLLVGLSDNRLGDYGVPTRLHHC